ncbi:PDZ domain-containing protein [Granulicella sp. 5B5]|uniref:S41 family peptidase n=1 Tax=Granulicella sp. 5B5 TaxID=1617967 RepID=UPI0015F73567|nr:S41 family peptidase [Granulicella sp. 5B5]QMV17690.1 PDZ domain-containing protein [Granulicella sp. 5B5]
MPKSLKISLLALSVALIIGVFLGVNVYGVRAAGDDAQAGAYKQINVYGEVLQHIQSDYVSVPNIPDVTTGALRGLLESLDADSSYLTPTDYKAYKDDKGGKAQVGLNVSKRYGYATIISVVPGSPAEKAGLNDGDIIEAISKQDTRDLSLAMIKVLLEGAPGSELDISVIRPRKVDPEKVVLNRVLVEEPPVSETFYEGSSILYLKPVVLDKAHVDEVEQKLKAADKTGTKKVLLDLRDVAAGDMNEAVRLANFFVSNGTIATLEGQKYPKQTFTAEASKAVDATAPLVVLVNRGTSGPAELVAGAIQDDKRGDLVGEKTFGEGSLQKTFDLPDGSAVILSIAKYASPSGKQFEDDAVTPGTMVASNLDDLGDDDTSLPAVPGAASAPKTPKKLVAPDDQLTKAIDMLKAKAA